MNAAQTCRKTSHRQPAPQALNRRDQPSLISGEALAAMVQAAAAFRFDDLAHRPFVSATRPAQRTRAPHTASR